MATLTELQTRREALKKALDSGVLSLREGDKQVTYNNAEVMARLIEALDREIAAIEGTVKARRVYPQTRKGW